MFLVWKFRGGKIKNEVGPKNEDHLKNEADLIIEDVPKMKILSKMKIAP